MTTTLEDKLRVLHDFYAKGWDFGDNNPADPFNQDLNDINDLTERGKR